MKSIKVWIWPMNITRLHYVLYLWNIVHIYHRMWTRSCCPGQNDFCFIPLGSFYVFWWKVAPLTLPLDLSHIFKPIAPFVIATKPHTSFSRHLFVILTMIYHCILDHISSLCNNREHRMFTHNRNYPLLFVKGRGSFADDLFCCQCHETSQAAFKRYSKEKMCFICCFSIRTIKNQEHKSRCYQQKCLPSTLMLSG